MKLELRKVADDTIIVVPPEAISQLGWEAGDLCEVEIQGDELRITRAETAKHAQAMKIARRGMEKYRDALAKLAKS
jgi:bifunctional DNA-binding transcriptional regulator/antitoxin component of YhaV-PrlF toxin-antitoxin module